MTFKILLDPGHGAGPGHNRGSVIGNEGDNNWEYSLILAEELRKLGCVVGTTRPRKTDDPSLQTRGAMSRGYDLFLSLHSNASSDSSVRGVEIFPDTNPKQDYHQLADNLARAIANIGTLNRGVRYWAYDGRYMTGRTKAPRTSNYFGVLRHGHATYAMLVEHVYHTNRADCEIYVNKQRELAKATAQTILAYYGADRIGYEGRTKAPVGTPIANQGPTVSIVQMEEWARKKGADPLFIELAPKFHEVALGRKIDPALLYAQSAKETNYMKFTGVLDKSFKNPCGLKTKSGGGNYDPEAHQRFTSWEQGIKAQADHLNLYAGADGYPMPDSPDPRHFAWIKGTAKTVEELGGKWAPAGNYGSSIVKLMKELQATEVDVKSIDKSTEELPNQEEIKAEEMTVIAYRHDGDLANALALYNALADGYLVKTDDASELTKNNKVIQVGGHEIKGADLVLAGKDRVETLEKVAEYVSGGEFQPISS